MLDCKKLAALTLALLLLSPPSALLQARTRQGDKLMSQGRAAEVRKQWDQALALYEQALSDDPADSYYQLAMRRARFEAGQFHVERGMKLRADGKTAQALGEFERAYAIDPSSSIADQEVRRTRAILEREKKDSALPPGEQHPENRGLTPAELSRKDSQERIDRIQSVPELRPLSNKPIDLKMNNQPLRVLYETLGKVAGVNVVFDPDIQPGGRALNVEFNGSTLEEALDYLSTLTKTFWKPLSGNTIFVTQDNTTKRRDYEDQVVKVFYLKNVNTPQELQEIAVDVRTICDIRRLFTYNAQMAIIVRAEADRVALAEKIIADLDKPKSEVLIDVLVLETNINKDRDLAFGLADGINSTIAYNGTTTTPASTTGTGSTATTTPAVAAIPLNRITHLSTGQYSVVLPNASLQATLSDRSTKVLQAPQVRAANNYKAVLKIGDKVPTASGSFQPGIGGVGINPLVNTQFQFLDVGVNVDITPTIHGSDEVSLHVDMDISQVRDHVDLGGISQPVIGQRKVTFDVRLREGEVNVLGGLMQEQVSKTVTGVPGLAQIPLIGHLFSGLTTSVAKQELLFVLIPHIVRTQELSDTNLRGISTGNDTVIKLNYAPRASSTSSSSPAATTSGPANASGTTPAAPPATAPPIVTTPAAPVTPPPPPPPVALAPRPPAGGPARVSFAPATAQGQVGAPITVSLNVENASDLFTVPLVVTFDQAVVRLNDVTPGALMTSDGKQLLPPSKNIQNDAGTATFVLTRAPGAGGVSGSGTLATFVFQPVGRGTASIGFNDIALRNSQLQDSPVSVAPMIITVQ